MEKTKKITFNEALSKLGGVHLRMNGSGYSDLIHFDYKNRKISNGKITLYENGKIIPQKLNIGGCDFEITEDMKIETYTEGDTFEKLEELYHDYKYSQPEVYASYAKCPFVALDIDELSRDEFNNAKRRQSARIALETFVFFNKFEFLNEKHHYRQSQKDKSLVLYKQWIN